MRAKSRRGIERNSPESGVPVEAQVAGGDAGGFVWVRSLMVVVQQADPRCGKGEGEREGTPSSRAAGRSGTVQPHHRW